MSYKQSQRGSALAVVSIIIVVLLVGVLGWALYQNMIHKEAAKKDDGLSVVESNNTRREPIYMDFRQGGVAQSGVEVGTIDDVNKLTYAGDKLAAFMRKAEFGKEVTVMGGGTEKLRFVIDRLQGDYAVGTGTPAVAYVLWGPEDGTGDVKELAGTQNTGFSCKELAAAKVPSKLVDGKCLADDVGGLVDYQN